MENFLDKFFLRSNNLDYICKNIKDISNNSSVKKIFETINSYSAISDLRYVGGCIRKIINKEKIDDIDLATNLTPTEVCEALKINNIRYYETGIDHGTVTAFIEDKKFEITSLREDISTDGRHAKVEFSNNWKKDASRRDFTINSIYSDKDGNLFDPFEGKKDLENGVINFIGDADKRIKEDYLRILRYLRFFLNYSKQPHDKEVIKKLKINIGGVSKLSKERLLDELKKICNVKTLEKMSEDEISIEIISLIFPELKNINFFSSLDLERKKILEKYDFIFILSLLIIDETDNTDYFLYKYNISKKDQKRIKIIDNFFKEKIDRKKYTENNLNKIFYYEGKQALIDILNFSLFRLKKKNKNLIELKNLFKAREVPIMPIKAHELMLKYNISEGKQLGEKLKKIEKEWVDNNFQISDRQVNYIINN